MVKPGATGKYPRGKINPADEGELQLMVAYDAKNKLIHIEFGKPVAWLAMSPQEAVDFGKMLVEHGYAAGGKVVP